MAMPGGDDLDRVGQAEIEGRAGAAAPAEGEAPEGASPAGPHAAPSLTEPEATPGTGSLPSPTPDGEADAGTG